MAWIYVACASKVATTIVRNQKIASPATTSLACTVYNSFVDGYVTSASSQNNTPVFVQFLDSDHNADLTANEVSGIAFVGWYTIPSNTSSISPPKISDATVLISSLRAITLSQIVSNARQWTSVRNTYYVVYAKYSSQQQFTVTWDGNGGTPSESSRNVFSGDVVGSLPSATRTSYTLTGWYTAASGGTQITSSTIISSDVTFYAHWAPTTQKYAYVGLGCNVSTTVSYTCNKTSPTSGSYSCTSKNSNLDGLYVTSSYLSNNTPVQHRLLNTDTEATLTVPSVSEKKFLGWYTIPSNTTDISYFKLSYATTQISSLPTITFDIIYEKAKTVSFRVLWRIVYAKYRDLYTYTITWNGNGGTNPSSTTVTEDSAIETLPTSSRTNCNFLGWFTDPSGGTQISTSTKPTSNTTYYAHWAYKVTWDANQGTSSSSDQYVNQGNSIGTLPTATRTGWTFNGWYTEISGGTRITSSTIPTEPVTYYAQWTGIPVTVIFDPQGGDLDASDLTRQVTVGGTFVRKVGTTTDTPLPTPTSATATFNGWFTSASGGTIITSTSVVPDVASFVTLYAQWTGNTISITLYFNANGGTLSTTSKTVSVGSAYGTLPTPTLAGQIFEGWYTQLVGGTQVTASTIAESNNVYLYAHWSVTSYSVVYQVKEGLNSGNYFNVNTWNQNTNSFAIGNGSGTVTFNSSNSSFTLSNTGTTEVYTKYSTDTGSANTYYSITLQENTEYTFSCTLSGTTTAVQVFFFFFTNNTSDGTYVSNVSLSFSHSGSGSTSCSKNFTVPSGCTAAQVRFGNNKGSSTATFASLAVRPSSIYGSLMVPSPETAYINNPFYVSNPVRTGYIFEGWTVTSGLNEANIFSISAWKSNTYSFELNQSSGSLACDISSGTITITNSQSSGEVYTAYSQATGAAYNYYSMSLIPNTQYTCSFSVASSSTVSVDVFLFFFTDKSTSGTYISQVYGSTTSTGSYSFNFTTPSNCTAAQIRFDNNIPSTVTISAVKITIPAKYGDTNSPSTVIGSSTIKCISAGAGGVWFTNLRNTSGSVTLTANWTATQYLLTVDYNDNTYTIVQKSPNLIYGSSIWCALGALSRTGYTFTGYFDSPNTSSATQLYDSSGHNLESDYWTADYDTGTFKGTSNLTVYAGWTANGYDIGYDNLFHYYGWARTSSRGLNTTAAGETLDTSSWVNADLTITTKSVQNIYTNYGTSNSYYNIPVEANTNYTVSCTFTGTSTNSQVYYVELTSDYEYVKTTSPYYTATNAQGAAGDKSDTFTTSSTCAYIQLVFNVHDTNVSMSFTNIRLCKTSLYTGVSLSAVRKPYIYNDDGNTTIGTLITPTKSGYSFLGWYTAETGGSLIDSSSTVNSVGLNRTLYSRWSSTARTITFNANGGSGTMSNQTVANNTATSIKSNSFTRANYDFLGWSKSLSGIVQYEDGADITLTEDQTLYAIWQPQVCYALFDANGGILPSYTDAGTEQGGVRTREDNLRLCRKGDAISNNINIFPTNKFRLRHFTSTSKVVPVGDDIQISEDASSITSGYAYANFFPYKNTSIPASGKYTLVFELVSISSTNNALSRLMIAQTNTNGTYQSQFQNTYWMINSPEVGTYLAYADGRTLEEESTTSPTNLQYLACSNTQTVYGGKLDCVVRVSIFGGTAISSQSLRVGSQSEFSYVNPFTGYIRCPLPIPTREGYVFDGWYDNTSGTGTKYTDDTTISSSKTLYAKWTAASSAGVDIWSWEWN